MNWTRGIFGVWVVLSVCWVGFFGWAFYEDVLDPRRLAAAEACTKVVTTNPSLGNPSDCFYRVQGSRFATLIPPGPSIRNYLPIAIGPPAAVLLLGLVLMWLSKGFRRSR